MCFNLWQYACWLRSWWLDYARQWVHWLDIAMKEPDGTQTQQHVTWRPPINNVIPLLRTRKTQQKRKG